MARLTCETQKEAYKKNLCCVTSGECLYHSEPQFPPQEDRNHITHFIKLLGQPSLFNVCSLVLGTQEALDQTSHCCWCHRCIQYCYPAT